MKNADTLRELVYLLVRLLQVRLPISSPTH